MESEVVEYRGQRGSVALQMHACAHCGSEYADAQDSLANKRAVMAFRKHVDGLNCHTQTPT
jgi:ketosteroid isomerase-like protein